MAQLATLVLIFKDRKTLYMVFLPINKTTDKAYVYCDVTNLIMNNEKQMRIYNKLYIYNKNGKVIKNYAIIGLMQSTNNYHKQK